MIKDLKFRIIYLPIGLLGYLFIGLFLPTASGQTMSNQNYIIQTQDINTATNVSANAEQEAKIDPSISEGVNFKVKTGFDTPVPATPFSFSLSSNMVDFGTLSPTNPVIRTVDLSVQSLAVYGYSLITFEDKPLTAIPSANKDFIPDTTCDNGGCSVENAAEWVNALTYGFGYRCDNLAGLDCDKSFLKANFYKHFPDIDSNDDPQSIAAGVGSENKEVRISYKINTSGNQTKGIYNNVITYIAVPNF